MVESSDAVAMCPARSLAACVAHPDDESYSTRARETLGPF